jgi:hypothetical protein
MADNEVVEIPQRWLSISIDMNYYVAEDGWVALG